MKLVHLVGFITKKFVTMQGYMNVKLNIRNLLPNKHSFVVTAIDFSCPETYKIINRTAILKQPVGYILHCRKYHSARNMYDKLN